MPDPAKKLRRMSEEKASKTAMVKISDYKDVKKTGDKDVCVDFTVSKSGRKRRWQNQQKFNPIHWETAGCRKREKRRTQRPEGSGRKGLVSPQSCSQADDRREESLKPGKLGHFTTEIWHGTKVYLNQDASPPGCCIGQNTRNTKEEKKTLMSLLQVTHGRRTKIWEKLHKYWC